ncbi:MAG: hypothetical protein HYZ37_10195, partial [Candidatus Solibacter usitatus]|nr:hypothetical protein [Candidatus Solibacter usitatus]
VAVWLAGLFLANVRIMPMPIGPGQVRVTAVDTNYAIAQGGLSGWFRSGQQAEILLSAIGFNRSGGGLLFNHPRSIASDGKRLILADSNNNRILIWSSLPDSNVAPDMVLGQLDFDSNQSGGGSSQMNWPGQVSVTPDGKLVIADTYNDRLLLWNSFPTQNGQAPDVILRNEALRWPWGAWTDGNRVVASATGGRAVLVWNRFPIQGNESPDFVLRPEGMGTPRTITSDGSRLIVGDHNAFQELAGNFFWKSFPTGPGDSYDYFAPDPMDSNSAWMQGTFDEQGRLLMLGRTLHVWNEFPESSSVRPNLSIQGYSFQGGDGGAVVAAGGRLYLLEYNGNRIAVYNNPPTTPQQRPDFAIGSPNLETNTLRTNFLMTNPVPATDGKSLFVSSDFDRRLYVWKQLPDESGAKPNWVYDLPFAPWDNEISQGGLALAGKESVAIWSTLPLNGEMPDVMLNGRFGGVRFQEIRGVGWDEKYFYLSDMLANKVYVWRGIPIVESDPAFVLDVRQPARISTDGEYVVITSTETHTLTVYRVADLESSPRPQTIGGPGMFNLPQGSLVRKGQLFVCDTTGNRVQMWRNINDALARRPADAILGGNREPANGRSTLFWPGVPAFDGSYLWVGEFKFSGRMPRFNVQPE